jgi:hypothetical protein
MILPPPDSLERLTHADLIGVVRDLIGEVTRMRAETEKLGGALAKLRVEHQAVKDELARLKHLPPRPPIKPSGMDKSTQAKGPEAGDEKGGRSSRRRGSQLDRLKIGAIIVVKADPPTGSRNKGFEDVVVQDLPGEVKRQHQAMQIGAIAADKPRIESRDDRLAVRGFPTFAAISRHPRVQAQVLNHDVLKTLVT